jgi:dipeptidyl aminopeptidase/acylaminoacyl peptidase
VSIDYPEDRNFRFSRIWVVDYLPEIGVPKQLSPKSGLSRQWPSWSADGSRIYYSHELWRDGPRAIYKINIKTGREEEVIPLAPTELSPIPAGEYYPKISPDGSKIAWNTFRHGIDSGDIYIADVADLLNSQYRVTPYSGWSAASWSPDGKRLVLTLQRYKLTEKSIKSLREIGFTDEILTRLKNVNDKEFVTEKEFLDGLKSAIGEELTGWYSYKILQNAIRNNTLWAANADGSGLTQLTSGVWKDHLHFH